MKHIGIIGLLAAMVWAIIAPAPASAQGQDITGNWMDMEIRTIYQIEYRGDGYQVVFAQDLTDGEIYPVTDTQFQNGIIQWSVHVPSTGYDITYRMVSVQGDFMQTEWWGTAGSGTETLQLYMGPGWDELNQTSRGNNPPGAHLK